MERFRYTKASIAQAISYLKTKKGEPPTYVASFPDSFKVKHGKLYAGDRLVISVEERDDYLREIIYGKKSEYPFGRDSLFAILKNEVLGVSKRNIEAFLNAQGPVVHRRSRPKKEKRVNLRQIRKPGQLSIDLVHVRAKTFEKILGQEGYEYMGPVGKRGYQQDRYFLNAVDLLTGYLLTRVLQGKTAKEVAPKLKAIIKEYEGLLKMKVPVIETDKGGEFRGEVTQMLRELKIRKHEKITNATVEQTNAKMQRIFYNLVEQRRGGFEKTWKQAVRISNRTRNRRTGMSPEDALKKIAAGEKVSTKAPKARATERHKAWDVGTKVRALKKPRVKADPFYKAYEGEHYGAVTPITKVRFIGVYPKYRVGDRWLWQDEVIKARSTDTKSHNLYIKRPVVVPDSVKPMVKPEAPIGPITTEIENSRSANTLQRKLAFLPGTGRQRTKLINDLLRSIGGFEDDEKNAQPMAERVKDVLAKHSWFVSKFAPLKVKVKAKAKVKVQQGSGRVGREVQAPDQRHGDEGGGWQDLCIVLRQKRQELVRRGPDRV